LSAFTAHSEKQWRLISSDAPITIVGSGTQWGKSMAASIWLKRQIHTFTNPDDSFLLLAPTYKVMNQSALPYFLRVMEGMGEWKESKAEFDMGRNRKVFMRTGKDPDSIIGIPNVKAYWLDEAGKATLYFWENIRARAASKGARGLLTTSPYSRNWLYKDFIKPSERGSLPGVPVIRAASWDNPYHTLADPVTRDAERARMDPRRFDMIFGGEWGQMAGLVYDCWDDDQNLIDPFKLSTDTKYYGGIDWGYYPDPFVLKIRAVTPDGRHYGVSEFVKTHMRLSEIVELCKNKMETYGIRLIYCDPSDPANIAELNANGIPATKADNSIRRGIDLHYELIKTRRYKEFRGACPHSASEREVYHYPEQADLGPDDDSKELLPVDQDNHTQDADRYLTLALYRRDNKLVPKTPLDPQSRDAIIIHEHDRLGFLKSDKGQSESWS
jgi:PBSX family phage terminase large subunit